MIDLMQLLEKEGDVPGSMSFLSSHPLTKERIKSAKSYLQEHPRAEAPRKDLQELFASLKSTSPEYR